MSPRARHSIKYAAILLGIVGAAIGLNRSVMELARPAPAEAAPVVASVEDTDPVVDAVTPAPQSDVAPVEAAGGSDTQSAAAAARDARIVAGRTEYLHYAFDGVAADIVIAYHDAERLELWSVTPEIGWISNVTTASARQVTVTFETAAGSPGEATFQILRDGGELRVTKEVNG